MKTIIITTIIFGNLFYGNISNTKSIITTEVINVQDLGKQIFENNCSSCHTGGFKGWVSGAPNIKDVGDWEKSLSKGAIKLTKNVFEGTKRHEEKGGCEDCTEEQIKSAVEYIISETKN